MIKGLFKLHFVVAFSCLIVGSVLGTGREIVLVSSNGEEFGYKEEHQLIAKSGVLQALLLDSLGILAFEEDSEQSDNIVIDLPSCSSALEALEKCSRYEQNKLNFYVRNIHENLLIELFNLANYLELEKLLEALNKATNKKIGNKQAKSFLKKFNEVMLYEFKKNREKEKNVAEEKVARKKRGKRQGAERRRAVCNKRIVPIR